MTGDARLEAAERRVDRSVHVKAPPEVVFDYFVDPAKLTTWMGTSAVLEAHPGGRYEVVLSEDDVTAGSFVEVVRPERVVFSWGWLRGGLPVEPGSSVVEVTFTPFGGGTLVRLVHRDLPEEMVEAHDEGWCSMLVRLPGVEGSPQRSPGA